MVIISLQFSHLLVKLEELGERLGFCKSFLRQKSLKPTTHGDKILHNYILLTSTSGYSLYYSTTWVLHGYWQYYSPDLRVTFGEAAESEAGHNVFIPGKPRAPPGECP